MPTAATHKDNSKNWILSWYPEGRSDSFTREAILACAPPTSGVYGLFNSDCQVFIGESDNIQEALLRHESETEFHSRHLQPTGFTYETCEEELRKSKLVELIAKYRPVMQTEAALTEPYLLSDDAIVNEPEIADDTSQVNQGQQQFPEHDRDQVAPARRQFNIRQTLAVALGVTAILGAVAIFYFEMPINLPFHMQAGGSNLKAGQLPTLTKARNAVLTNQVAGSERGNDRNKATRLVEVKPIPISNTTPSAGAKNSAAADPSVSKAKVQVAAHPSIGTHTGKKWSVQVSAAPAKDIADVLLQKLQGSGHMGYVVPAEVNGKSYFRVRVGPFDKREEAEFARQSVARDASYRDAYLTAD